MNGIILKQSKVVFNEQEHTYELNGRRLQGITGLIHAVKNLGVYPNADEYTKRYRIPRAGAKGTALHKAIEFYDTTGTQLNEVSLTWHERNDLRTEHKETFEVADGIRNYIAMKQDKGFSTIENEYNVQFGDYASNIDIVIGQGDDIYLADIKTNNLDYYPNGKSGLIEYLSWQLSAYAVMFERQTGLKVAGLIGLWFRDDKHEYWVIDRKSDADVLALLNTKWEMEGDAVRYYNMVDGEKVYVQPMVTTRATTPVQADDVQILTQEELEEMYNLQSYIEARTARLNELKAKLQEGMASRDIKSMDCAFFKASYTPATTSQTFDSARFKAEHKDIYDAYMKTQERKGSIRLTFKKEGE